MPGAAVFLNEAAGSAGTTRVRRMVELARRALDADLHVIATRDPAELTSWLDGRIDDYDTAVIVGGDGSLASACNVAARRGGPTVGYLPAGFGNAAAHLLRLPSDPEGIVGVLVAGDARPIDMVAVGDRLALFAGAGWDARVAGRYADAGARGLAGWAAAVTRSVPDLLQLERVEIRADGLIVHRGPLALLVISTTPFYGRGLKVNPGARPDAGRLSLRAYRGPAPRLAIEAMRWAAGIRPRTPRVDAQQVELRALAERPIPVQADGDLVGESDAWSFEIRPAAVRIIGRWS